MSFTTADLYDEHEESLQIVTPMFNDYGGKKKFSGSAATVKVFEDNSLVRTALEEPGVGKVLVVDGGASLRCALFGDMLAELAKDNGWEGIIVYGCIRDSAVGECAIVDWLFFSLSMAEWSLVCFSLLLIVSTIHLMKDC
ncbi:MAG: ribonuclease E activity regulator RraA [Proteobacteria bacterium]|nr:ribonuclease E activity regulator RraA [Pseudomonadota bacterium]